MRVLDTGSPFINAICPTSNVKKLSRFWQQEGLLPVPQQKELVVSEQARMFWPEFLKSLHGPGQLSLCHD